MRQDVSHGQSRDAGQGLVGRQPCDGGAAFCRHLARVLPRALAAQERLLAALPSCGRRYRACATGELSAQLVMSKCVELHR